MKRTMLPIAFLWGAAEASFFVIVPDVFVSLVAARRGTAMAVRAALAATVGAIAGGIALWFFVRAQPEAAAAMLLALPGIDAAMRAGVANAMEGGWFAALLRGSVSGVPYKLYVAEAATRTLDPALFFAASVPARLLRFAAVALIAGAIAPRIPERWRVKVWAGAWLLIYACYFILVGV